MSSVNTLAGKHIVVGVTGSIAAYKAAELIRRLRDYGAEIRVVMTHSAMQFITPLTLQTLSGHPVAVELLDADQESAMGHIALARWADWILVAPASADFIARLVHGRADDLLTALILATEAPLLLAPAMNNKMWSNPATQANIAALHQRHVFFIGPASGDQACGEQGEGRMEEPVVIAARLAQLNAPGPLTGKHVLVTAGPTYEAIDPVRFIGNRSSGKMGFAIAQQARELGATVTLVAGPVNQLTPNGVMRVDVESAQQMFEAVASRVDGADIFIACAAVSDYRPSQQFANKIKKQTQQSLSIALEPTQDILSYVSEQRHCGLFVVGFAAETEQLATYARDKLQRKKLDMIAANLVGDGKAFGTDDNALEVFWGEQQKTFEQASKQSLAKDLIQLITEQYDAKNTTKNS